MSEPFVDLNARDLIFALRGMPERCDFCHDDTKPEELNPMSGGEWVCNTCWDRWEKESPMNGPEES